MLLEIETLVADSFKCSKDRQNFRNLWIIFFARRVEPALFKWRPLRPKCLLVMFLLSSISMFKSNKWPHRFLTVSAALPLSDLIVGVENVTSVSGKVSLIRVFSFRSVSKISLDIVMLNGWQHFFLRGQWCVSFFLEGLDVHENWDNPQ